MSDKNTSLPDGFGIETPEWHFDKLVEFTMLKQQIGEPSPHLTVVGHISKNYPLHEKVWLLGCYGASYCLPTAQVLFSFWSWKDVLYHRSTFDHWLKDNWAGIVTRTERRCVRSPEKFARCLHSYANWMNLEFPKLQSLKISDPHEFYDVVWDSVNSIYAFGRYISIRVIEGLRRYCGIPAEIYDLRSIGGWSPKKCLCYLYPEYAETILVDDKEGNDLTNILFEDLLERVGEVFPAITYYVLAAMLCEYRGAYENKHQYVGWTIDQEPLLYDKVIAHFGKDLDPKDLWKARKDSFPKEVLGEISGWNGTRWELTEVLRNYGYNWADLKYDYIKTLASGDFEHPVRRTDG